MTGPAEQLALDLLALPEAQRLEIANRMLLSIEDPRCRLAVYLVARNATTVAHELERRAFVARDRDRRVL